MYSLMNSLKFKDNILHQQARNCHKFRPLSFDSFFTCNSCSEETSICSYLPSKYCVLGILFIGFASILAYWSKHCQRQSPRTISEKDEEVIMEKLLDRIADPCNKTVPGTQIHDENEGKIRKLFSNGLNESSKEDKKAKDLKKKEECNNVMNTTDYEEYYRKRERKCAERETSRSLQKELDKELRTPDNRDQEDLSTMIALNNIDNQIRSLEQKIHKLSKAIRKKPFRKDCKETLRKLNSIEERLICIRQNIHGCSESSMSSVSAMTEKLVGIEDFLSQISQNLEISPNIEESTGSNVMTDTNNIESIRQDFKVALDDPGNEKKSKTMAKNCFKDDLNKLLEKYFGDELTTEECNGNIRKKKENLNAKFENPFEENEICEEHIKQVAQLRRELDICILEKEKADKEDNKRETEHKSDILKSPNNSLDPEKMIQFKKDLEEFLRKHFKDELGNIDWKNRDAFEKTENGSLSLENEIIKVIEKELFAEKNRTNMKKSKVQKIKTEIPSKEDLFDVYSRSRSTLEIYDESRSTLEIYDDLKGERSSEAKLIPFEDLKVKLEKMYDDRLLNKNNIESKEKIERMEKSNLAINNALKQKVQNDVSNRSNDNVTKKHKRIKDQLLSDKEKSAETFLLREELKDNISKQLGKTPSSVDRNNNDEYKKDDLSQKLEEALKEPIFNQLESIEKSKNLDKSNLNGTIDEKNNHKDYLEIKNILETKLYELNIEEEVILELKNVLTKRLQELDNEENKKPSKTLLDKKGTETPSKVYSYSIPKKKTEFFSQNESSAIKEELENELLKTFKQIENTGEKHPSKSHMDEPINEISGQELSDQISDIVGMKDLENKSLINLKNIQSSREEFKNGTKEKSNEYITTKQSDDNEPSAEDIKAVLVLLKDFINQMDDKIKKPNNQVKFDLPKKSVDYIHSETENFEQTTSIDEEFQTSKEKLKHELTEEIKKHFSSQVHLNEMQSGIRGEIEKQIDRRQTELKPKKSFKNHLKNLIKFLPKPKRRKDFYAEYYYHSEEKELEERIRGDIIGSVEEKINSVSNYDIESQAHENKDDRYKNTITEFTSIYQIEINDHLKR